jgi:lipoprotein-anchoring transpeptidase ErfK/SrfK
MPVKSTTFLTILASALVIFVSFSMLSSKKAGSSHKIGYGLTDPSLGEVYKPGVKTGVYEGEKVAVPQMASSPSEDRVLGQSTEEKWIEVNLTEQKLRAWQGSQLFLETPVSTGLPGYDTPTGEYRIWSKFRATKMEGGSGRYYYYLPNVPYVMFFENGQVPGYRGYSLHGTYWHNDFGRVHSHGCVNLPTPVAKKLYYWTTPDLPEGKSSVRADAGNIGTRIVIHK